MMYKPLLAVTALASQAAAFLVPLEVAKAAKSVEETFHLSLINQKQSHLSLECPGCYFDTAKDRQDDYASQPQNTLSLNFTVNDRDNSLALNGQKLFPLAFPRPLDLYAPLVRSANGIESPLIHLGFALEYLPYQDAREGTIVPIRLTIVDLDSAQVQVPTVTIDVIKLPSQELLIGKVDTIPFEDSPGTECRSAFCRVRAIAIARMREMLEAARERAHAAGKKVGWKGCGAHRPGAAGFESERPGFHHGRLPGHRRPPPSVQHHGSHSHSHGQHHHRHHHHGLRKFLHQAVHLFIIPAMLGIVGGLTASAIGMFIGQLIVFVWFRFVRGGQRGNASARNETAFDYEKEALVDQEAEEMPPAYTDDEEASDDKH